MLKYSEKLFLINGCARYTCIFFLNVYALHDGSSSNSFIFFLFSSIFQSLPIGEITALLRYMHNARFNGRIYADSETPINRTV